MTIDEARWTLEDRTAAHWNVDEVWCGPQIGNLFRAHRTNGTAQGEVKAKSIARLIEKAMDAFHNGQI